MVIKLIKQKKVDPKYTLFIPFSREWMWREIQSFLVRINFNERWLAKTEILFCLDSNDHKLYFQVYDFLSGLPDFYKINSIRMIYTEREPLEERASVMDRRKRIAEIRELGREYVDNSQIFFSFEDDTIPPDDFMNTLHKRITNKEVGFIQGIEVGRWDNSPVGAWHIEEDENGQPIAAQTLDYKETGIEEIEGGGAFCYAVKTKLLKETPIRVEEECFGPDVNFVYDIVKKGYKALVDWDIKCDHHTKDKGIIKVTSDIQVLRWEKREGKFRCVLARSSK